MKHILLALLVVLSTLLFTQCKKASIQALVPDLLKQQWVDSFEEASEGYTVFRPADYKDFAVSRFRLSFELGDNDACTYLVLAPNDVHYVKDATWEYNAASRTIKIKDEETISYEFEIIELGDDILKVSKR